MKDKEVKVYCGPRGKRSKMAVEFLKENDIDAEEIPTDDLDDFDWMGQPMVTAINYLP